MKEEKIIQALISLPVILVMLYFVPFVGICLILLRIYERDNDFIKTPLTILFTGVAILFFRGVEELLKTLKIGNKYIEQLTMDKNYIKVIDYGKFLIGLGVILLILSYLLKKAILKLIDYIKKKSVEKEVKKEQEIKREVKIESKEEHTMECPNCGSKIKFTGDKGYCKYCRSIVDYKKK